MKRLLCAFLMLASAVAPSTLAGAASIVLSMAGPSGVSATISPDPGEIGQPAKIWMGAVLNGIIYLRNGASSWAEYRGGPLPVALTSTALPSSLQVSIVNFDISSLPGLDVYVGYGSTEADLWLSGHLTKVYTVPTVTPPPVGVPAGKAPITLTSSTPAATFAALQPVVKVGSVTINSAPVVTFSMADANDNPIIGWGSTSKSATATVASYPNLAFTLAKLVPGTNGSPSRWVSYIVTTVPTTTAVATGQRPGTDNTGTLVDNKNGTYTYTFYRDITKVKDQVAAMTLTAPNGAADLGDITYEPNLVHRLAIQVSGNAPGTGTNTPNAVQVTPGVPLKKPVDVIYDFIPAANRAVTATDPSREIVATAKCLECHNVLGGIPGDTPGSSGAAFHGGARNDTRYCVTCHTEQRRYGRTEATISGNTFTSATYIVDGRAIGNFPNHIHHTHMGSHLTKKNYNFGGLLYNEVKFPQDLRNCTKCHDGSATSTARTAQGDNWKNVPNRLACGGCHDGINFATGEGLRLEDARAGLLTSQFGHVGGAQANDSRCALCHSPAAIDISHFPVTPPNLSSALHVAGGTANTNAGWVASNTARLPAGAIVVTYDVQSVSRNASKQPVMVFRFLQNGARKDFNVPSATKTEMWDNFMGSPSAYFAFAVPQDGVAAPADFNASASGYLRNIWNKTATGTGAGTLTGPDADGYYTVTLTGVTIPDSAVMLSGGLGFSYNVRTTLPLTQTNLAAYPVAASPVPVGTGATDLIAGNPNMTGGLVVVAPTQQKVATGYTGRRTLVEDAKCNRCHQELGAFTEETFHGRQHNDATTCSWCHHPNRTSNGWGADSTYYIHAIHGGAKRTVKYTWHAASATEGFFNIKFPGILKDCETCHVPGAYDFSAAASASALPNRLYRTVASGTISSTAGDTYAQSPYVTKDLNYGALFAFNTATGVATQAAATTLVNSPIATACFACHDSDPVVSHMRLNGGSIYAPRSTALATTEQCTLCHLAGKVADIKLMHTK